jgi:flagellar hook-basal body complex protein FliE
MDAIGPVMPGRVPLPAAATTVNEPSFREVLEQSIERVGRLQTEADGTIERLRAGQATEAEALQAIQQARMAMDAMAEIRDRVVQAFQEIQQMRI